MLGQMPIWNTLLKIYFESVADFQQRQLCKLSEELAQLEGNHLGINITQKKNSYG